MFRKLIRQTRNSIGVISHKSLNRSLRLYHIYPISYSEPQDIFIVGFPKSGNTWMQNLVSGVLYGIDTHFLPDTLTQELVPDIRWKMFYKRMLRVTCFKSHSGPDPRYRKAVHLVRDPRDVMVSYYYMNTALGVDCTLETMVKEGAHMLSTWKEHTNAWLSNPYDAEMLIIRYEDLLESPMTEMERFCIFAQVERPADVIERAVAGNSFEQMVIKEERFGHDQESKWREGTRFFRRGVAGSYKDELPGQLARYIEETAGKEMAHFGYL